MLNRRGSVALVVLVLLASAPPVANGQPERPYLALMADRIMTPAPGIIDLLTIQRLGAGVEDRWLPPSRFRESTRLKRALGIGYRFGKWYGLDLPQDHFLMVVGHEVFGHGARLRELGGGSIRYRFDAPIPYGSGGAVTVFEGDVVVTRADVLGIESAGIEAQNVLADHIGREALAAGTLRYRAAWLYLESRLDQLRYIHSVSPRSGEGHDVRNFLLDFNADCDPPACTRLTASALKQRALVMLADPVLAYAGYGWAVSNLVRGHASAPLPVIPLSHDVRYLPALRFEMTPYGTAVTSEHTIIHNQRLTRVSVGAGDTGRRRAWDIGVLATDLVRGARIRADLEVNVWQQPSLDSSPNSQVFMTGSLVAATARIAVGRRLGPVEHTGIIVQVGYKSDGFVRGERLHAGPIVRIGMTILP